MDNAAAMVVDLTAANISSPAASNATPRITQMVDHIRSNSSSIRNQVPQYPNTDFVELPDDDMNEQDVSFVYDTVGEKQQSFKCPNNIGDMLIIVRQLQSQVEKALPTFEFSDPNRTSLYTTTNWSNTSQSRITSSSTASSNKTSNNNYDQNFL